LPARPLPRNQRSAAGQIHPHLSVERPQPLTDGHRRTRAGAAGEGFTRPPFEHAQQDMVAADDLHETHIGAVRKARVPLDTRPKPLDWGAFHLGHVQHHVRVAHGERAHLNVLAGDVQREAQRLGKHRYAHVHRHQAVISNACAHFAAAAAHDEIAAQFRRARIHQCGHTARTIAALFDLDAVGIEHSIENPARAFARRFQHQRLIEADARMAIGEGAKRPFIKMSVSGEGGGVEYQEIVAEALHLQELDAHAGKHSRCGNFPLGGCAVLAESSTLRAQQNWGIMRHVMVLNAKGGCGKSTLSTNIAVFFAREGHNVCIADYDPQRSSLDWLAMRPADLPAISAAAAFEDGLRSVPRNTDILVIDAPARVHGTELNELVRRAETIIVPVLPSSIDMKACGHFMAELLEIGKVSRKQARLAVLANRVREHTLVYEELDQYLSKLKVPYLGHLREAQNYVRAYSRGMGVLELPEYLAWSDWKQWEPIAEWLGSKRSQPSV
jgi:chromosome partitioning protein